MMVDSGESIAIAVPSSPSDSLEMTDAGGNLRRRQDNELTLRLEHQVHELNQNFRTYEAQAERNNQEMESHIRGQARLALNYQTAISTSRVAP